MGGDLFESARRCAARRESCGLAPATEDEAQGNQQERQLEDRALAMAADGAAAPRGGGAIRGRRRAAGAGAAALGDRAAAALRSARARPATAALGRAAA